VVSVDGPLAGVAIACESGTAWITQCCDSRDYVLEAGMNFSAYREGQIIVQIMKAANISINLRGQVTDDLRHGLSSNGLRFHIASLLRRSRRFLTARR